MRDERFEKVYDELLEMAKKNNLELHEIINFMLSFIIFNISPAFDEEDAREFCRSFYAGIIEQIGKRRCRNGGG